MVRSGLRTGLDGVKILVPENLSFPSEETGFISSKAKVCSVNDIPCVSMISKVCPCDIL